jgi:hypothetical protein
VVDGKIYSKQYSLLKNRHAQRRPTVEVIYSLGRSQADGGRILEHRTLLLKRWLLIDLSAFPLKKMTMTCDFQAYVSVLHWLIDHQKLIVTVTVVSM